MKNDDTLSRKWKTLHCNLREKYDWNRFHSNPEKFRKPGQPSCKKPSRDICTWSVVVVNQPLQMSVVLLSAHQILFILSFPLGHLQILLKRKNLVNCSLHLRILYQVDCRNYIHHSVQFRSARTEFHLPIHFLTYVSNVWRLKKRSSRWLSFRSKVVS